MYKYKYFVNGNVKIIQDINNLIDSGAYGEARKKLELIKKEKFK